MRGRRGVGRLLLAGALAATSLVMFGAAPAFACRCAVSSTAEHAARAEAVFVGEVTATRGGGRDVVRQVEHDVEVAGVHKGDVPARVTVTTSAVGAACGLPDLPHGEPLMFFGSGSGGTVRVSSCGGTAAADRALVDAVVAALGERVEPMDPGAAPSGASGEPADESGQRDDDTGVVWVLGGGLLLLGLAAAVAALRRRRRRA